MPVYLTNATMETYFWNGYQTAGALEQHDRLSAGARRSTRRFGTESYVGCYYSAGAAVKVRPVEGQRVATYGENRHDGLTGNGDFSWLLQIEAQSKYPSSA